MAEEYFGAYPDRIYTSTSNIIKTISFNGDTDINKVVVDGEEAWRRPCKIPIYGAYLSSRPSIQIYSYGSARITVDYEGDPGGDTYFTQGGNVQATIPYGTTGHVYVPYGSTASDFHLSRRQGTGQQVLFYINVDSTRNGPFVLYFCSSKMVAKGDASTVWPPVSTITSDIDTTYTVMPYMTLGLIGYDGKWSYPNTTNRFPPGEAIPKSYWDTFANWGSSYSAMPPDWPPTNTAGGIALYSNY